MRKTIKILVTLCLVILLITGCSKKGNLGGSNKTLQNNPKVVEPYTAYPFQKGLHKQKLSMTLDKAVAFYKETYPTITDFILVQLRITNDRYVWELTGTDGTSLYMLEFDALTKEISWEGTIPQSKEQQETLPSRSFSPAHAIAYTKAISAEKKDGSVNGIRLENLGGVLTYTIHYELEDGTDTTSVNAETGEVLSS